MQAVQLPAPAEAIELATEDRGAWQEAADVRALDLVDRARRQPGDDLISTLAAVEDQGDRLSVDGGGNLLIEVGNDGE